jgi:hypothetical protein
VILQEGGELSKYTSNRHFKDMDGSIPQTSGYKSAGTEGVLPFFNYPVECFDFKFDWTNTTDDFIRILKVSWT